MINKVYPLNDTKGKLSAYGFYCPGCKCHHSYDLIRWKFNDDLEKPTFKPSLVTWSPRTPEKRCHLFVTDGANKIFE